MIGKLLRGGAALLLYFCLATVIAEVVLLVNFVSGGKINRDKLIRMFAVAHGIDEELYGGAGRDRDDVGVCLRREERSRAAGPQVLRDTGYRGQGSLRPEVDQLDIRRHLVLHLALGRPHNQVALIAQPGEAASEIQAHPLHTAVPQVRQIKRDGG